MSMDFGSLDLNALVIALTGFLTAAGVWIARRNEKVKSTQSLLQVQINALSDETERLREHLNSRDLQSEKNYIEITQLRSDVAEGQKHIFALEAKLTEWTTGVRVLTHQLEENGIAPAFIPSA
jgi:chromosome segregation ATPase